MVWRSYSDGAVMVQSWYRDGTLMVRCWCSDTHMTHIYMGVRRLNSGGDSTQKIDSPLKQYGRPIPSPTTHQSGAESPTATNTKEATSHELRQSAVILGDKIEALFGVADKEENGECTSLCTTVRSGTTDQVTNKIGYADETHKPKCLSKSEEREGERKTIQRDLSTSSTTSTSFSSSDISFASHTDTPSKGEDSKCKTDAMGSFDEVEMDIEQEQESDNRGEAKPYAAQLVFQDEKPSYVNEAPHLFLLQEEMPDLKGTRNHSNRSFEKPKTNENIGWSKRRSQLLAAKHAASDRY